MRVGDLRRAVAGVDDEMVVVLRVSNEAGNDLLMCSPDSATPDPDCADALCFVIDGTEGECEI